MKNIALIFAGGTGQRMGSELPKQFLKVSGREIIIHTLELFENNDSIDEIYVACIKKWIPELERLIRKYDIDKVKRIFPGGKNGQDSIFLGLEQIHRDYDDAIVLIHDGVRPLVTEETIANCIDSVLKYRTGITVNALYETPLLSEDGQIVKEMIPRKEVYMARAPQCFYLKDIYQTHLLERVSNPDYQGIVDSCSLMMKYGYPCHMVEGNRGNIKVTTREDYFTLIANFNALDYETGFSLGSKNSKKLILKGDSDEKDKNS